MRRTLYILILLLAVAGPGVISCKNTKDTTVNRKKQPTDPYREAFHEAIQEKMRGNYDKAAVLFEKCLGYDDKSDAAHYALSDMYQQLGQREKSIEHAHRALELDPENRWYQLRLADIYFNMGSYHKSARYYEMAIQDEKNIDVKFQYAESLIYSKQYKEAIKILDELEVEMGISPHLSLTKHDLYQELGDAVSAREELNRLIEDNPSNVETRLVIADYFLRTNQVDAAEKIAADAMEMAPNNGEIRLIMADIAIRKGKLNECFDHLFVGFKQPDVSLSRKIALIGNLQQYAFDESDEGKTIGDGLGKLYEIIYDEEAKNDTLHAQYGYYLQMKNKPLEAIEQFQLVVSINPDSYDNWMQLMYLQFHIEDYEGMFKSGKEVVELFPAQPNVYLLSGIAAYEMKEFETAEEWLYYGKGLVVNDKSLASEFEHQIGNLNWKQGDYEAAHHFYDEAKLIDQFNGNIYRSEALCYIDEGKEDLALKQADAALEQAPNNAFFHDLKGLVLFKTGKYTEARKAFENALIFESNNSKVLEHLGDTLFKLGEKEEAVKKWQKAMENGGYNATLVKKIAGEEYYAQ